MPTADRCTGSTASPWIGQLLRTHIGALAVLADSVDGEEGAVALMYPAFVDHGVWAEAVMCEAPLSSHRGTIPQHMPIFQAPFSRRVYDIFVRG